MQSFSNPRSIPQIICGLLLGTGTLGGGGRRARAHARTGEAVRARGE